jgi:hypothetical protein
VSPLLESSNPDFLSAVPDRRRGFAFTTRGPTVPLGNPPLVHRKLPRHNTVSLESPPEVQERILYPQAVIQPHGDVPKPHDYDDGRGWRHGHSHALYDGTSVLLSRSRSRLNLIQKNLDPEQLKEVQESQARMVKMQSSLTSGDFGG